MPIQRVAPPATLVHGTGAVAPQPPVHGGLLRHGLGRIGFRPEFDLTLGGIWRARRTLTDSTRPDPFLQPRDVSRGRPTPSVAEDHDATQGLQRLEDLVRADGPPALIGVLEAGVARLRGAPHLETLDDSQRMLASAALYGSLGSIDASDSAAATRFEAAIDAFAAGHFDPEQAQDAGRDAAMHAARALRALTTSGGSGAVVATRVIEGCAGTGHADVNRRDIAWLTTLCAAADALDPARERSFQELRSQAAVVVAYLTPPEHLDHERPGAPEFREDYRLDQWLSSAQLRAQGKSEAAIRNRIPAIAMSALHRHAAQRSEVEHAAISAVRNGLMHDLEQSDLSFATHRTAKLATYARRVEDGLFARLRHKNPLQDAVRTGEADRPVNAIATMRSTMHSAQAMASIFDGLRTACEATPGAHGTQRQAAIEGDASYHAEVFRHWGDRFITTQQLDTRIEEQEKHELLRRLEARLGTEGPEIERGRQMLWRQELAPTFLEQTGWTLVGYLRETIDAVAAAGPADAGIAAADDEAPRDAAREQRAMRVVSTLGRIEPPAERPGAPGAPAERPDAATIDRARAVVSALESSLLPLRSGPESGVVHPERVRASAARADTIHRYDTEQARRADPIGFLANVVKDFELGSSITMSNGRFHGVNVPFGAATAWIVGSPVQALGRLGIRGRKEAVVSVGLSSTGGEIFLGTARSVESEASFGAAVGMPAAPGTVVGVGGTLGGGKTFTEAQGVYLRIPRNGEADGGAAQPGLNGDHIVARRQSEVLAAIDEISRTGRHDTMLMTLMARFPELSVSVVRERGDQAERKPRILRAGIGTGLFTAFDVPGIRMLGLGIAGEMERGNLSRRKEQDGRSNVSVRGQGVASVLALQAGVGGIVSGSGADLASVRMPIVQTGLSESSVLLRQDGAHSGLSYQIRTTPNLGQFRSQANDAMPGLVAFALTRDRRRATLTEARVEGRELGVTVDQARQRERGRQASAIANGIEHIEHAKDKRYALFSLLRPDAAETLDHLHAMRTLSRGHPELDGLASRLDGEYERVAAAATSFRPAYAFQYAERIQEKSRGWPFLLETGRRTMLKWNGVSDFA